jgi:uroporphyrinogen decarboxylase
LNSLERVTLTLNHEEADHVPVYPILSGVTRTLAGASYEQWSTDADICAQALLDAADQFKLDCIVSLIDLSVECDAWGTKLVYPQDQAAHPDFKDPLIKDISEYEKIKKVDYKKSKRMMMHLEVCRKLVEKKGHELPVIAFVFGPLGTLSMMRNQQEMYMDIYDDRDAVKNAAREVNETLKEYCDAIIDTGVHGIMLDTLFASGSIMSKKMWLDMEGDLVKELADGIHKRGCMVMIHNCGEHIYFDAQIETMRPQAISFLYPPDDCKDYSECKKKYGDKITLIGCVPPPMVITATDDEWENVIKEQIDIMAPGGGFMLATGCEYPANASFERAIKMVELANTYGRYS